MISVQKVIGSYKAGAKLGTQSGPKYQSGSKKDSDFSKDDQKNSFDRILQEQMKKSKFAHN